MTTKKLERLQEKKAQLRDQLAALAKEEAAAVAAEKAKRRKADNQIKLLIGVATIAASRGDSPTAKQNRASMLSLIQHGLTEKDRAVVLGSALWQELAKPTESAQDAPKANGTGQTTGKAPETPPAAPQCPKCGKPMKRKNGPRGDFWGCTDYPGCDGSRSA